MSWEPEKHFLNQFIDVACSASCRRVRSVCPNDIYMQVWKKKLKKPCDDVIRLCLYFGRARRRRAMFICDMGDIRKFNENFKVLKLNDVL